jgi:uncharacterized membrane-anchored protein
MSLKLSQPIRTLIAGAICLMILSGMLVVHAWPLWTGQPALLPVTPIDPRDIFRGEYVALDTPATRLALRFDAEPPSGSLAVKPVGPFWASLPQDGYGRSAALFDRVVYVQLERGASGEHHPVSISIEPLPGQLNLRGRIQWFDSRSDRMSVDYGLDSYFMQEGSAKAVEDAVRTRGRVQMEIAIARSGHARIRRLIVDGVK